MPEPPASVTSGQAAIAETKLEKSGKKKKRKVMEDETSEEGAERKRKKKEQKARRVSIPSTNIKESD